MGQGKVLIFIACILIVTFFVSWQVTFTKDFQTDAAPHEITHALLSGNLPALFEVMIEGEDLDVILETVDAFHEAMTNSSVPYFIYGGTLLGSWRHHGFVPWDDDVDMAVPFEMKPLVRSLLSDLKPHFRLNTDQGFRWKFCSRRSQPIPGLPWGWPYVDISFYRSNETHVWDNDVPSYPKFIYPIQWIFPLRDRPFKGRMLPAPVDAEAVLNHTYDLQMCTIGDWEHQRERRRSKESQHSVPCAQLKPYYPFVRRVVGIQECNETLVQNETRVLSWFSRDFGSC